MLMVSRLSHDRAKHGYCSGDLVASVAVDGRALAVDVVYGLGCPAFESIVLQTPNLRLVIGQPVACLKEP